MSKRIREFRVWRDLSVEVTGCYDPAEGPSGPSYSSGGDPGCDAEFEPEHVRLVPDQKGADYIDIDGHIDACDAWDEIRDLVLDGLGDPDAEEYEYQMSMREDRDDR